MISTQKPEFQKSTAPALCKRCEGVGSIWIYSKEHCCERCKGNGVELKSTNNDYTTEN